MRFLIGFLTFPVALFVGSFLFHLARLWRARRDGGQEAVNRLREHYQAKQKENPNYFYRFDTWDRK